jgi:hypothetical protein
LKCYQKLTLHNKLRPAGKNFSDLADLPTSEVTSKGAKTLFTATSEVFELYQKVPKAFETAHILTPEFRNAGV